VNGICNGFLVSFNSLVLFEYFQAIVFLVWESVNTYFRRNKMKQGHCPKCNSDDLSYETIVDVTPSDQAIYYPFECNNCGFEGKEYYNLHFTEFTDEDDNPITEDDKDYCEKGNGCKHLGETTCCNAGSNCFEERD
jgi:hypothetical protein